MHHLSRSRKRKPRSRNSQFDVLRFGQESFEVKTWSVSSVVTFVKKEYSARTGGPKNVRFDVDGPPAILRKPRQLPLQVDDDASIGELGAENSSLKKP